MKIVNNILVQTSGTFYFNKFEYLPDKFIIKNVLQNKLKCDTIKLDKETGTLNIYWKKE